MRTPGCATGAACGSAIVMKSPDPFRTGSNGKQQPRRCQKNFPRRYTSRNFGNVVRLRAPVFVMNATSSMRTPPTPQ